MKKVTILFSVTIDRSISFHKDLALTLAAMGHDVHFVSSPGENLSSIAKTVSVHPIAMERNPKLFLDILALLKWIRLLNQISPDIVIGGTPKASLLSMLSARILRIPRRIFYSHGLRLETAQGFGRRVLLWLERFIASCATEVIAVSPSLKQKLISEGIASEGKISVLGHGSTRGVDTAVFQPLDDSVAKQETLIRHSLLETTPVIGFIGRITRDKGIAELKDALIALHQSGKEFQFVIVGRVEDSVGKECLEELQQSNVPYKHLGYIEEPAQVLQIFDVLCLPSYREGLSGTVLEAFACGVPVVASDATGISDIVSHNDTGILVPVKDVQSLTYELKRVLGDETIGNQISVAALEFVRANFSKEIVLENHLRHILEPA